jgi:hypothetical protein
LSTFFGNEFLYENSAITENAQSPCPLFIGVREGRVFWARQMIGGKAKDASKYVEISH